MHARWRRSALDARPRAANGRGDAAAPPASRRCRRSRRAAAASARGPSTGRNRASRIDRAGDRSRASAAARPAASGDRPPRRPPCARSKRRCRSLRIPVALWTPRCAASISAVGHAAHRRGDDDDLMSLLERGGDERRGLGNALGGPDRGPAEFHDDEHMAGSIIDETPCPAEVLGEGGARASVKAGLDTRLGGVRGGGSEDPPPSTSR